MTRVAPKKNAERPSGEKQRERGSENRRFPARSSRHCNIYTANHHHRDFIANVAASGFIHLAALTCESIQSPAHQVHLVRSEGALKDAAESGCQEEGAGASTA